MRRALPITMLLPLLAGACASPAARPPIATAAMVEPETPVAAWEAVIRAPDRARLDRLGATWAQALAAARESAPAALAEDAELVEGGRALDHPALPPGSYRCRTVRLGTPGPGQAAFEAFRPFFCFVQAEGDLLTFTKQTGSDLPAGWLYSDPKGRYVFLGTRVAGEEPGAIGYGEQPEHDLIGVVERIGAFRWRLVLPGRGPGARLDIYELIPVPPEMREP